VSDTLKWLDDLRNNARKRHAEHIKTVLSGDMPQHILVKKELLDDLKDADNTNPVLLNGGNAYIKESVVNRLMYLTYLDACHEIDKRSFDLGRRRAIQIMTDRLEEL
jgi:hypothetical protein